VHQFTAQQVDKGGKEGTNFHSSHKIPSWMFRHVNSKATYLLRVHQFTAQQVGNGGTTFHSSHKISSWMFRHVHSKATYPLRVYQFTAQQVGKGGKERTTHHTKSYLQYASMFIQRQLTLWECTSSQHRN